MGQPKRQNFSLKIVETLRAAAASTCANPSCRRITRLANRSRTSNPIITGDAAHIFAPAKKGPRGNGGLSLKKLKDISNAIWLCLECHRKVDRIPELYTAERLTDWKTWSEQDYRYEYIVPVLTLPAVRLVWAEEMDLFGAHTLVSKTQLHAVCKKLFVEVISETTIAELRARSYYEPEDSVKVGKNWTAFSLSQGYNDFTLFGTPGVEWSPQMDKYSPVLFRLAVPASFAMGRIESIYSSWEIGIVRRSPKGESAIEVDEFNTFADLSNLCSAGVVESLLLSKEGRDAIQQLMKILAWNERAIFSSISPSKGALDPGLRASKTKKLRNTSLETIEIVWNDTAIRFRHKVKVEGKKYVRTDYSFYNGVASLPSTLKGKQIKQITGSDSDIPPYKFRPYLHTV